MNIFTQIATEINQGVNRMEYDINERIDLVKHDVDSTIQDTTTYIKNIIPETSDDKTLDDGTQELLEDEETQKMLEDPQISDIFNDLRTEFPEPTGTPGPTDIPVSTSNPAADGVMLEGFENIPLPTAVRVNNHLKQQFVENFKF